MWCSGGCSWKCYKTLTFCSLLTRCTIPCACHAKRHLNLQKWSGPGVFCTFLLRNVLRATTTCTFSTSQLPKVVREWCVLYILTSKWVRATTACTFSTSQLPKVVRTWCVLYILTSTRVSRHNGVHFFDISTSKSGPNMVFFVHFDFEMCLAPQLRALFRHLNFQKWSEGEVVLAFSLANVLRATTACNFSSLIWPAGSAPAALASLLCSISRLSYLFAHLDLLSSETFSFWSSFLFSSLLFSSLTLTTSAFHLSIVSEVWLLNFLRWFIWLYICICICICICIYIFISICTCLYIYMYVYINVYVYVYVFVFIFVHVHVHLYVHVHVYVYVYVEVYVYVHVHMYMYIYIFIQYIYIYCIYIYCIYIHRGIYHIVHLCGLYV